MLRFGTGIFRSPLNATWVSASDGSPRKPIDGPDLSCKGP